MSGMNLPLFGTVAAAWWVGITPYILELRGAIYLSVSHSIIASRT